MPRVNHPTFDEAVETSMAESLVPAHQADKDETSAGEERAAIDRLKH